MCENVMCKLENCYIPYGFCHCGCGGKTNVSLYTSRKDSTIKGNFCRYCRGHGKKKLTEYLVNENGCWIWQLAITPFGYGQKSVNYKSVMAHRWYYEKYKGPIPEGLFIDHICGVRHCVNPNHLEAVTTSENTRRGNSAKLDWGKVKEIREIFSSGFLSITEIALEYSVSYKSIWCVIRNKSWVEVEVDKMIFVGDVHGKYEENT